MSPIPYHKQEKDWTCGPAALRMIFEKIGIKKTEEQMTKILKTNPERGTWHKKFSKAAKKYKLKCIVKKNSSIKELENFSKKGYFIIICYYLPKEKIDHYAVFKNINYQKIFLIDPWYGPNHKYKLTYFERMWKSDSKYGEEKKWFFAVKK